MRARCAAVPAFAALLALVPCAQAGRGAAQQSVKISASAVPWVIVRDRLAVSGTVTPHPAGIQLTLEERRPGTGWRAVGEEAVRPNGAFSFATRPGKLGLTTYRVATARGTSFTGTSEPVRVRVLHWAYLGSIGDFAYTLPISGDLSRDPIAADGVRYEHPLSLDAGCYNQWDGSAWIDFPLAKRYEVFTATMALGGVATNGSTATYSLIGAGRKLASGNLEYGMSTKIRVSVSGVYRLRLQVNVPDPNHLAGCGTAFTQVVFGDAEVLGA